MVNSISDWVELTTILVKRMWKRIGNYEICWQKNKIRRAAQARGSRTYAGRLLKKHRNKFGYFVANVTIDGKHYDLFHQVVALVYHGPCPEGKEVNHEDTNKQNNDPKNLKYVTHKENTDHAKKNGLWPSRIGVRNPNSKLTDSKVKKIRELYLVGKHTQQSLGDKFGVSQRMISDIVNRNNWSTI